MKVILAFLILGITFTANAEGQLSCQEAAQIRLNFLKTQGLIDIGPMNIERLSSDMFNKTKWITVNDRFMVGSGGDRATAIYDVENNRVYVNQMSINQINPKILPDSCLHEGLGANGHSDENYEKTLSIRQLSRQEKLGAEVYKKILSDPTPKRTTNKVYSNQKGGTSIGGGGDWTTLDLKGLILDEAVTLFSSPSVQAANPQETNLASTVIEKILNMKIEPNWDANYSQIAVTETGHEVLVTIPSVQWYILTLTNNDNQKSEIAISILKRVMANL